MSQKTLLIEGYSLFEFLAKLQVAILEGYVLSDKNDYAPVNYGNQYVVTLVEAEEALFVPAVPDLSQSVDIEVEVESTPEPETVEVTEDEPVSEVEDTPVTKNKPGRKPKNS